MLWSRGDLISRCTCASHRFRSRPQLLTCLIDDLLVRQHAPMEDAGYKDAPDLDSIEDDMPAVLHPSQAGANAVACAAEFRIFGYVRATCLKAVDITKSLIFAPFVQCVVADFDQVGLRAAGKTECGHSLG